MPSYNYAAINDKGRTVRGVVIADNELDLEARLKHIGLDLVNAKKTKEKKAGKGNNISLKSLIVLCMHMEQLDRAGVPLHDALADVRDSTDSAKLRDILTGIYEAVKNGTMLSKALATYPRVFNDVFVGLIAAGEKTGDLSASFAHLNEHLKWSAEIRRKIKKATRYPAVLLVVIAIVITVMMTQVVPKLVDFITSQGFELPWHTQALIATSSAFTHYWYLIFGIPIFLLVMIVGLYRQSPAFSYKIDALILKLPLIGPVASKIDLARFTHFFAVMFNSGIDVLDSLEAAKGVVHNRVLKEAIDLVKTSVSEGSSLTASLRMSNQFPTLVIRMFKVGEDSGNMGEALENINFFYNREVNDAVDTMVGAIQPILTVIMGLLIFWIIAAMFGPLYDSFSKMQF